MAAMISLRISLAAANRAIGPSDPTEGATEYRGVARAFRYLGVIFVILLPWMPSPAIRPFCPKMTA